MEQRTCPCGLCGVQLVQDVLPMRALCRCPRAACLLYWLNSCNCVALHYNLASLVQVLSAQGRVTAVVQLLRVRGACCAEPVAVRVVSLLCAEGVECFRHGKLACR